MKNFLKVLKKMTLTLCLVCALLINLNIGLPGNVGIVPLGDDFYFSDERY